MPLCDYEPMPESPDMFSTNFVQCGEWAEVHDSVVGAVRVTRDGKGAALITLTGTNGEGGVRLTPVKLQALADILHTTALQIADRVHEA